MTITYFYDFITRDKRLINVTNKQIKGVKNWLLKYYKNNEKKTAIMYIKFLKL